MGNSKRANTLQIVALFQNGEYTSGELSRRINLNRTSVNECLALMKSMRLIHVAGWRNARIPVYGWGDFPDIRKPGKVSATERARKSRERRRALAQDAILRGTPLDAMQLAELACALAPT